VRASYSTIESEKDCAARTKAFWTLASLESRRESVDSYQLSVIIPQKQSASVVTWWLSDADSRGRIIRLMEIAVEKQLQTNGFPVVGWHPSKAAGNQLTVTSCQSRGEPGEEDC
jgi:hypothetical protein